MLPLLSFGDLGNVWKLYFSRHLEKVLPSILDNYRSDGLMYQLTIVMLMLYNKNNKKSQWLQQ